MASVKYCLVRLIVSCLFLVSVWHSDLTPSLCHPDEFKSFLKRLPSTHFLPISSVHLLWGSDWDLQARYRLLQSSLEIQRLKIQRTARKLFGLSIRCHHNPNHQMPRERWVEIWPPHHKLEIMYSVTLSKGECFCVDIFGFFLLRSDILQ